MAVIQKPEVRSFQDPWCLSLQFTRAQMYRLDLGASMECACWQMLKVYGPNDSG